MNNIITKNTLNDIELLILSFNKKDYNNDDLEHYEVLEIYFNDIINYYTTAYYNVFDYKLKDFAKEYFIQIYCQLNKLDNLELEYNTFTFKFNESGEDKEEYKNILSNLLLLPQQKQKSQEWYDFRRSALTASNITKIIQGLNINNIILDKCGVKSKFISGPAILHGIKYEDNAIKLY